MEQAIPVSPTEAEMNTAIGIFNRMADTLVGFSSVTSKIASLEADLAFLREVNASAMQERDTVKAELAATREQAESVATKTNGYQSELTSVQAELATVQERVKKLDDDLLQAWIERDDAKRDLTQANDKLMRQGVVERELRDELAEARMSENRTHENLVAVTKQRDDGDGTINHWRTKYENLKAMVDQVCEHVRVNEVVQPPLPAFSQTEEYKNPAADIWR